MTDMIKIVFLCITVYLAGSINFAILLFKITGKEDPRSKFSGNPGTTNIYRQAGKLWAVFILLLDVGRAIGIAFLCIYILQAEFVPVAGFFLILGNKYPCFHQFRGGKGVANYLGFTLVFTPLWAAIAAGSWVIVYFIVRTPFIASFFMILTLAAGTMITYDLNPAASTGAACTAILIFINHKSNIKEFINKHSKQ
ncbi:MAG: glycerol-3-phosphate acyltransferase [Spirochaetes bacterium]|nr:glycerol-3-phosphate acyltransferase [Spirochaetota bacterium]